MVFQLTGAVTFSAAPELGGLMVHNRSVGCVWDRQISSMAELTDCNEQFWLSQVTEMPVVLLSGMVDPLVAGLAAHSVVESHVALCRLGVFPPPPPPHPASQPSNPRTQIVRNSIMRPS